MNIFKPKDSFSTMMLASIPHKIYALLDTHEMLPEFREHSMGKLKWNLDIDHGTVEFDTRYDGVFMVFVDEEDVYTNMLAMTDITSNLAQFVAIEHGIYKQIDKFITSWKKNEHNLSASSPMALQHEEKDD